MAMYDKGALSLGMSLGPRTVIIRPCLLELTRWWVTEIPVSTGAVRFDFLLSPISVVIHITCIEDGKTEKEGNE